MSLHSKFLLEDLYNQVENQTEASFSTACMPAFSLEEFLDFTQTPLDKLLNTSLDYSTSFGDLELRTAIKEELYPSLNADQIFITNGSAEAIYLLFQTLFKAGDTIIVQKPIYQSLYQVAEDNGVEIIDFDLSLDREKWDLNELEKLIKTKPEIKALVINNPNNPTGYTFSTEELKQISSILGNRPLIADEIFQNTCLYETSSIIDIHKNSIVISGLSKAYCVPGLRIGWLAVHDPKALEQCSSLKNYLSIRNSTLSERLAIPAIKNSKKIKEKNLLEIQANLSFIQNKNPDELFFELPKTTVQSLTIMPKIKNSILEKYGGADKFSQYLLEKYKILLVTGSVYSERYKDYCRIGLGKKLSFLDNDKISF